MRKLTFENSRGKKISFGPGETYCYSELTGLGDVAASIQMQHSPYQDGGTFLDAQLNVRPINFEVYLEGKNDTDISKARSQLASLFNPKLGAGKLTYQYGEIVREIEAVAEHVPIFPKGEENRWETFQLAIVNLICPDPYWKSPTIIEEPMSAFVELFELPSDEYWHENEQGDLLFEVGFEGEKRTFDVTGHAAVPIEITFHGPLLNPTLRNNTTGQMIRVNRRLESGDQLKINTADSSVYLNEENVFHWIDIDSEFWNLQSGTNEVEYFADEGIEQARLEIRWQERYLAL